MTICGLSWNERVRILRRHPQAGGPGAVLREPVLAQPYPLQRDARLHAAVEVGQLAPT